MSRIKTLGISLKSDSSTEKQLSHGEFVSARASFPIRLWAHDLQDPSNIGGLFRLADAFGVEHIYLSGKSPTPPSRKIHRAARSTHQWIPYSSFDETYPVINELRENRFRLYALEVTSLSMDITQLCPNITSPLCWLLGSEKSGISTDLLAMCDQTFHIPMYGRNSSMNITTAAAIALFSSRNQGLAPNPAETT